MTIRMSAREIDLRRTITALAARRYGVVELAHQSAKTGYPLPTTTIETFLAGAYPHEKTQAGIYWLSERLEELLLNAAGTTE